MDISSLKLNSKINSLKGSKQQMLKLEDSFVDGSFVIPEQGSEESSQREGQYTDLADKGPEITRKCGVSMAISHVLLLQT